MRFLDVVSERYYSKKTPTDRASSEGVVTAEVPLYRKRSVGHVILLREKISALYFVIVKKPNGNARPLCIHYSETHTSKTTCFSFEACLLGAVPLYRGTSLMKKRPPLGP